MTLRGKTIIITSVVLLALVASLYFVSSKVLLEGFLQIERSNMERNVNRAQSALADAIDNLAVKISDWSYWDDSYKFMKDLNNEYVESNLQQQAFINLEINYILFFDSKGRLKFGKGHSSETLEEMEIPQELIKVLSNTNGFINPPNILEPMKGLIKTDRGPLMAASRHILSSDSEGPSRGTLVFAKYVDDKAVERLSKLAHIPVEAYRLDREIVDPSIRAIGESVKANGTAQVVPQSESYVHGYGLSTGIDGEPLLLIRVGSIRDVYAEAQRTEKSMLVAVISAGLVFGLVMLLILERSVISRIASLLRDLKEIQTSRNLRNRVTAVGTDEISYLGVGINEMLSGLEETQVELIGAKIAAEEANQAKSDFVANISHEVRTPLNGILGMAELTLRDTLPSKARESIRVIRDSGQYLLTIINDLLDFSKVESGKLTIESVHFSLGKILRDTVELLSIRAKEKNIYLELEIAEDVTDIAFSDPVRIRQIVTNLVGNSLKFTEKGGVSIKVSKTADFGESEQVRIDVIDTGIGIPESKLGLIFEPFSQADGSTTRKYGGTGLGLTITKRFIELLDGQILVTSEVGKGSVFSVTLPIAHGEKELIEATEDVAFFQSVEGLKVLVADDVAVNRDVARRILEQMGCEVELAVGGAEAVKIASERDFDLIFMDLQMPDVDGYEASRGIRRFEEQTGRIKVPIVALSAHISEGEIEKYRKAGIDKHAEKPLNLSKINQILSGTTPKERMRNDNVPVFAFEELYEQFGNDIDMVREIVEVFRDDYEILYNDLSWAVKNDQRELIKRTAHALKGGLLNSGALAAAEVVSHIEEFDDNAPLEAINEAFIKVSSLMNTYWEAFDLKMNQKDPKLV